MRAVFFTLLLCSCVFAAATDLAPMDSVGFKKIDGKYYVQHKVEKGQGLFAVARRYDVSVDDINKANPEAKDGLRVGQVLNIPVKYTPEETKQAEKPKKEPELKKPVAIATTPATGKEIIHVVQAGETLYKISTKYNVPVDDIKKLNNLQSNNLDAGQKLVISRGEHTENYGGEDIKKEPVKEAVKAPAKNSNYDYNTNTGEVKETGMCEVVASESIDQTRSFALHPTAPIGTIIMVTNTENNKSVFVRITGRMDAGNDVVLKLTKAGAERIGLNENSKVKVNLSYAK